MRGWRNVIGVVVLGAVLAAGGCDLLWTTPPEAPTGVDASDGGYANQIVVVWQAAPRTSRYEVWRSPTAEEGYEKVGETPGTTFTDTAVTPNVLYWYKVKACNRAGCSEFSQADSGYAQGAGVPMVPQNVSATDAVYTDRVRVTWSDSPGAARYEVWRGLSRDGVYNLRATVPGMNLFDDLDVVPGRVYWYRVKACNDAGCSALSAADSGYSFATAPEPPTNLSASDGTYNDRVRLTWTAALGAANYEVERATAEGGPYSRIAIVNATTYDDTGVTAGTNYWYRVRACNAAGCSAYSVPDMGFASTGGGGGGGGGGTPALPGQPQNVRASDGEFPDKIRITWSSVSGATRYEVWRADTDTGSASQIAETTGTSYDDTAPALCEVKWYEVRACNASGCGPFSVRDDGYRGASLQNVDGSKLKATVVWTSATTAEVQLEWAHIEKASEYNVVYEIWRRSPGTVSQRIAQTSSATFTDTTVQLGTTYYYKVRACSAMTCIQCSAFTAEVQAVVACNPAPPTNVTATKSGANVVVTWTAVTGATGYEVYRSTSATGDYTKIATVSGGGTTSYTDSNPPAGTYYYKVKTCVNCGCGGLSAPSNGVTVP